MNGIYLHLFFYVIFAVAGIAYITHEPQEPPQCEYTQERVHDYIKTAYEYGRESIVLEKIE